MTPPFKTLPSDATRHESIRHFLHFGQGITNKAAQAKGKPAPEVRPQDIEILEGIPGDGEFTLRYTHEELDLHWGAPVSAETHDMKIQGGPLSAGPDAKPYGLGWIAMKDACSVIRTALGEEELAKIPCQDGVISPKLVALVPHSETLQNFEKFCASGSQAYIQKHFGAPVGKPFSWERTRLVNTRAQDGILSLYFEDLNNGFFCQGDLNSRQHFIKPAQGSLETYLQGGEIPDLQPIRSYDDCALIEKLSSKQEFLGPEKICKQVTRQHEETYARMEAGWSVFETILVVTGIHWLYKKGSGLLERFTPNFYDKTLGRINRPVRAGWDATKGWAKRPFVRFGTWAKQPFIRFGSWAWTGLRGLAGSLGTRALPVATRVLPASVMQIGGRVITGLSTGAGLVGLKLGASFAAGFGVGYLIEHTPRWLGAKKSVSDGIAWGLEKGDEVKEWAIAKGLKYIFSEKFALDERGAEAVANNIAKQVVKRDKEMMVAVWDATLGKIFS